MKRQAHPKAKTRHAKMRKADTVVERNWQRVLNWQSVLLSSDLLTGITSFQAYGLHEDMFVFVSLRNSTTKLSWREFLPTICRRIHAVLAPWLATHGASRLPKLFACFDNMFPLTMLHAIATSDLPLLHFLHENFEVFCHEQLLLLDTAAQLNNLLALQVLLERGHIDCTTNAMDHAAVHGNLEMLEFLHTKTIGHFQILKRAISGGLGGRRERPHCPKCSWRFKSHTSQSCFAN
ncbi:Aste57867_3522 [Aphanomyces stellatus]|uniref:Aste57867_3522 protein n=1 Tax=Aphanomyces stellatus TaxID=120398 RepID=A0A485KBK4_9STRA|nr:hypothetical protein As57867_003511 [Aphanomyces stellatus]VFT80685.1 Aste57867_3522 [Aphanomyces stellatus]